jgi:hypothetical protein
MDREAEGRPSNAVIVGVAVLLLADVLFAFAIHQIISTGTCSSTGYTRYGPAPLCPKGSAIYGLMIPVGAIAVIVGGMFANTSLAAPSLFIAIAVGSLAAAVSPSAGNGSTGFAYVFGGCFAVGGLVWGAFAISQSTTRPPPVSGRSTLAGIVWVAAIAGAVGLGLVIDNDIGTSARPADLTRAPAPRDTNLTRASATDPLSMFKATNLTPVLHSLETRFGSDASVVQLSLYPEQIDLVIADNGSARLVTADVGGILDVSSPGTFEGPRQSVDLSQIVTAVPGRLAREIERDDGVPIDQIDHFALNLVPSLAHWQVYTSTGGQFSALLTGGDLARVSTR